MAPEPPNDRIASEEYSDTRDRDVEYVRGGVARGALFMVMLRLAMRVIGLVSTLILVRLLVPSDFGLVALAMVSLSLLDLLSDLSLQPALIRMSTVQRSHYDTAWTLGLIRGLIIALVLIAAAPAIATFFHEPRVVLLTYVLATLAVLQNLENVRLADIQRSFRFELIFWYRLAGKMAGFVVCIVLAITLRNYWALVGGIFAGRIVTVMMSYVISPYWPRLCLNKWRDFFHFSKWLMVTNLLWVIDANLMNILIGRVSGTATLGTYQIANQIGSLAASEIAAPIRDPLYAGYTRLLKDLRSLGKYYLDNLELLIAIISPLSLGALVMAVPITELFLGPEWVAAIPLIQFCALVALFDAIGHFPREVYIALGHQRDFVMVLAIALLLRIPMVIVSGLMWGVVAAAAALAVSAVLNAVLWNMFIPSVLQLKLRDFVQISWRTALACSVMVLFVLALKETWPTPEGTLPAMWRFGAICAAGGTIHVMVQLFAWYFAGTPDGAEASILRLVRRTAGILQKD